MKRLDAVRTYVKELVFEGLQRIPQPRIEFAPIEIHSLDKAVDTSTVEIRVIWGEIKVLRSRSKAPPKLDRNSLKKHPPGLRIWDSESPENQRRLFLPAKL